MKLFDVITELRDEEFEDFVLCAYSERKLE